jgi:hypothetical protein
MLRQIKRRMAIRRIQRMEAAFDRLSQAIAQNPASLFSDRRLIARRKRLLRYYEGGGWMADYRRDERGELPTDLKRGVLSEDGLWNLLTDMEDYRRSRASATTTETKSGN